MCSALIISHCLVYGIQAPGHAQTVDASGPSGSNGSAAGKTVSVDQPVARNDIPMSIDTTASRTPASSETGRIFSPDILTPAVSADTSSKNTSHVNEDQYPVDLTPGTSASTPLHEVPKVFIDTAAMATDDKCPPGQDTVTAAKSSAVSLLTNDTNVLQPANGLSKHGKIAAALGTTVILGSIVAIILYKKHMELRNEAIDQLPPPPDPPGI
jgi:hypothetical protein